MPAGSGGNSSGSALGAGCFAAGCSSSKREGVSAGFFFLPMRRPREVVWILYPPVGADARSVVADRPLREITVGRLRGADRPRVAPVAKTGAPSAPVRKVYTLYLASSPAPEPSPNV